MSLRGAQRRSNLLGGQIRDCFAFARNDCSKLIIIASDKVQQAAGTNEQPRSKLRGIEHPGPSSFRGKPRGIGPAEIEILALTHIYSKNE